MSPDPGLRYVITAAPPNPNGDLHLGHLSGPFLGADVLRRFLRQQGHEAVYVSYSDDYSCYVRRRAAQLGCSTERVAYTYGRRMEETLALAQLSPDCFTHPQSRPRHAELVQRFFLELWDAGALVVKDMSVFFCAACRQHLYEAEVSGLCPHCGEQSGGLECEQCARRLDTTGLREPRCTGCGAAPQVVELPRIVLPLERGRDRLAGFVAAGHRRPRLAEFLDAALQQPLPDVPFTRLDPLGVPVPLPGWEGHVLDTWFSGIWGYFAAASTWAEAAGEPVTAEQLWKDPDTRIIHFLGFDCSFSHALFWPGLLLAHGDFRLPDEIITNEFYRLEGEKFSTSRGHAIWGGEFLREQPADAVRFHLCLDGPETSQTSFSVAEFAETTRTVLRDGLQAWADGVLELVHTRYGGIVPEPRGSGVPADPGTAAAFALPDAVAQHLAPQAFSLRGAAEEIRRTVERLPGAGSEVPVEPGRQAGAVALQVEALARVACAVAPLLPGWSGSVLGALRVPPRDPLALVPPWPGPGTRLVPGGTSIARTFASALRALP